MVFHGNKFPSSPGVYIIQTNVGYYIGSSENLAARRSTHESRLKRKSKKLSNSWVNCWDDLRFVIWHVAEITNDIAQARKKEQEIIKKALGTQFCLNSTSAVAVARPKAQPCFWNGKLYPSISAAANESKLNFHAIKRGLEKKYLGDDDYIQDLPIGIQMKIRNDKIEFNGMFFDSLKEACDHSEWSRDMFARAVTIHGCKTEDEINQVFGVHWNGKYYKDYQRAAEESTLNAVQIGRYYQKGVRSDSEFEEKKTRRIQEGREKSATAIRRRWSKVTVWEGVEYPSRAEAYKSYSNPRNISIHQFSNYLNRGWVCEADVKLKKRGRKKTLKVSSPKKPKKIRKQIGVTTIWEGVEYISISEAYRAYDNPRNITLTAFSNYIKRGWTCEADVKFKKRGRKKK